MRSFGFRLTLLAAILVAGIASDARALGHFGSAVETVYVMPSSVTLPVPTSYVVSTSYVRPTAYAVPTYYTTAYWMDPVVLAQPTYAVETTYRRGLLGRWRAVERPVLATYATSYVPTVYATSYAPTTYYAPTTVYRSTSYSVADPVVVPSAYVASSDCVCPSSVAPAAPIYVPSREAPPSGGGTRSRSLTSEPQERESMESNVEPYPNELDSTNRGGAAGGANTQNAQGGGNANQGGGNANQGVGNANQAGSANQNAAGGAQGAGKVGAPAQGNQRQANPNQANPNQGNQSNPGAVSPPPAPPAPAGENLGTPPPINPSTYRRDSYRPTYVSRQVPPEFRNVLMGNVVSRSAGEPEEGVRISVRNAETGAAKSTTTDAFGRFAVRLGEGNWAVDVTMPSGKVYEVSRLRIIGGLITDDLGRRVPTLDITR